LKVDRVSDYYRTAEWHITKMKSTWALAVYNFALRISKESGVFFCSAVRLAEYFGCNERSIRRAYKQLLEAGFFELTDQVTYEPNVYKVVRHKLWAEKHPGQCPTKLSFAWSSECSRLVLIRLFQHAPSSSIWACRAQRFRRPCASSSRCSLPKRLARSIWLSAAGRTASFARGAGTRVLTKL